MQTLSLLDAGHVVGFHTGKEAEIDEGTKTVRTFGKEEGSALQSVRGTEFENTYCYW